MRAHLPMPPYMTSSSGFSAFSMLFSSIRRIVSCFQPLQRSVGPRWAELADAWEAYIDDGFCSFSDLHAMLALVGARDWASAQHLEKTLAASEQARTEAEALRDQYLADLQRVAAAPDTLPLLPRQISILRLIQFIHDPAAERIRG